MLSAGDVHGCLRKLESLLRVIKYPGYVDYSGLSKGDPSACLPVVSFTLSSFSTPVAEELMSTGLELTGKTDLRFTDALYKALRDVFHYKPVLTKQQFLQWGFSQRKISLICDIINLVIQKHNQLKKPRVRCLTSHTNVKGEAHQLNVFQESKSPVAVNCIEDPSTFVKNLSDKNDLTSHNRTNTPQNEAYSSSYPENVNMDLAGLEDSDTILPLSELEGRLSALEAQLQTLLSGLDRLSILEKRLEEIERNTKKNEGQVITICKESWENLMSRVLLLETKLELKSSQLSVTSASPSSTSSNCDVSKEDFKDKLESITNILKSTSTLLKNTSK